MAQQGLFRRKPQQEAQPSNEILEALQRSRTLEERYYNLERRSQVIEENMLDHNRKLSSGIKSVGEEVSEMKKSIAELSEKMELLVSELKDFARREEVQVIKKYLDYWQPLNFVTQKQVERIVKDLMEDKK